MDKKVKITLAIALLVGGAIAVYFFLKQSEKQAAGAAGYTPSTGSAGGSVEPYKAPVDKSLRFADYVNPKAVRFENGTVNPKSERF